MSRRETQRAHVLRTAAVLQVNGRSIKAMRDFFVEQLGFSVGTEVGRSPAFVTLDRDGQTVMLSCERMLGFRKRSWAVYFWTDNVEHMFDECSARGARIKNGLVTKDYGCREFVAVAPDGREIVFGQLVPAPS